MDSSSPPSISSLLRHIRYKYPRAAIVTLMSPLLTLPLRWHGWESIGQSKRVFLTALLKVQRARCSCLSCDRVMSASINLLLICLMQIVACLALNLCQVSLRGLSALEQVPDRLKALVDAYVHTPQDTRRIELELLQVNFFLPRSHICTRRHAWPCCTFAAAVMLVGRGSWPSDAQDLSSQRSS